MGTVDERIGSYVIFELCNKDVKVLMIHSGCWKCKKINEFLLDIIAMWRPFDFAA